MVIAFGVKRSLEDKELLKKAIFLRTVFIQSISIEKLF